jgi:cardiolipin synthase
VSLRWIPAALTYTRFAASPLLAWLLYKGEFRLALALVLFAGLTDWFDGFSARLLRVTSKTGVLLDPLADKTLLVTLFLSLGILGMIPLWVFILTIARDFIIVGGSVLLRIFRNRRKFIPSVVGKISTFFQIVYVLLVLIRSAFTYQWLLWLETAALILTAIFTTISGLDYIRRGIQMTRLPPVVGVE